MGVYYSFEKSEIATMFFLIKSSLFFVINYFLHSVKGTGAIFPAKIRVSLKSILSLFLTEKKEKLK